MDDFSVLALASLGTVIGALVQTVVSKNKRREESLLATVERLELDLAAERELRAKAFEELETERAKREDERVKRYEAEQKRIECRETCEHRKEE